MNLFDSALPLSVKKGSLLGCGEAYFSTLREALLKAQHSICISAWDIDSQIELLKEDPEDGYPIAIGELLGQLLRERKSLHVYVLLWDYSMIYAREREHSVKSKFGNTEDKRLHFCLDDALPLGASQHEKVVIVDSVLAFCGGFDVGRWRWDSHTHQYKDSRRKNPDGEVYSPFYDTQLLLAGDVVDALADNFKARWERAQGQAIESLGGDGLSFEHYWPASARIVFENIPAGMFLTRSQYRQYASCFESEAMHLDAIAHAREYIYIENQYFSSRKIARALKKRLKEESGPHVVMILTEDTNGLLEESTMGAMRDYLIADLRANDVHRRFSVYYPCRLSGDGEDSESVYVHSKFFIVDGVWLKVGTSNLSNRSMRVDSECDLLLDFREAATLLEEIYADQLGGLCDLPSSKTREILQEATTLTQAFERLEQASEGRLKPLPEPSESSLKRYAAKNFDLDPTEPIDPEHWILKATPADETASGRRRIFTYALVLIALVGLAFVGRFIGDTYFQDHRFALYLKEFSDGPWLWPSLFGGICILSSVGVPLNLLIVSVSVVFSPWIAFVSGLAGSQVAAWVEFGIGRRLGSSLLKRVLGHRYEKLYKHIRRQGVLPIAILRMIPIAPFFMLNLACGATGMRFKKYFLGSLLGMTPGVMAIALMSDRIMQWVRNPNWTNGLILLGIVVLIYFGYRYISGALRRYRRKES